MLSNWGKGIPKHMDSKIRIAGNDIFNFIRKLVEFKLNIAYCVIIRGKGIRSSIPFIKPACSAS